jgi:hypothetical protein
VISAYQKRNDGKLRAKMCIGFTPVSLKVYKSIKRSMWACTVAKIGSVEFLLSYLSASVFVGKSEKQHVDEDNFLFHSYRCHSG